MVIHRPRATYVVPVFGSLALGGAHYLVDAWAQSSSWWNKVPFVLLISLCLAFTLGLLVQDIYNESSWLRAYWDDWNRIVRLERIAPVHHATAEREWIELTVIAKFVRTVKSARFVIRVFGNLQNPRLHQDFVVHQESLAFGEIDQIEKRVIAVLPVLRADGKPLGYPAWGDRYRESGDVKDIQLVSDNSENVIEVEMRTRWRRQKTQTLVSIFDPNRPVRVRVLDANKDGERLHMSFLIRP